MFNASGVQVHVQYMKVHVCILCRILQRTSPHLFSSTHVHVDKAQPEKGLFSNLNPHLQQVATLVNL